MRKQQVQRLEHTFFLDDVTTETNQTTSIVFTYVWFVECVGPQQVYCPLPLRRLSTLNDTAR